MAQFDAWDFADCGSAGSVVSRLKAGAMALGFDAVAIADLQDVPTPGMGGIRWLHADGEIDRNEMIGGHSDEAWQAARRRIAPFLWPDMHLGHGGLSSLKLLKLSIPDLDPASVGTIPIHGPGGSVACMHVAAACSPKQFAILFNRNAHALQALAIEGAQRLIELGVSDGVGTQLTERQQDVLHWVVQGKTNWEIGQILGISPDTVRQHVMHIAGALKVRNRVQVAATAVARGICAPALGFPGVSTKAKTRASSKPRTELN